jgi:hypothetical protein
MGDIRHRLARLEHRAPDCISHTTPVLLYPAGEPVERWLATQRCHCGRVGCPHHRVCVALPQKGTRS